MIKAVIGAFVLVMGLSAPGSAAGLPLADYVEPNTGMEFVAIPGGTFVMGHNKDRFARPEHEVTIKSFLLGRFEVTWEQYARFCSATGRTLPADNGWGQANRPAVNISWQDAVDFTAWLSKKAGRTFRLPSEAEWEFAARGGTSTPFPWGNDLGDNRANCKDCGSEWGGRMTAPVGSFAPNGYGLYDMIGNVYEWCLDAMYNSYEGAPTDGSARMGGGDVVFRINRGGSWFRGSNEMTVFRRCWERAATHEAEYGFRVLLER